MKKIARIEIFSMAKDADVQLGESFTVKDFACKDGSDHVEIDLDLIDLLQEIRNRLGKPRMIITSGYRTVSHNASEHVQGDPKSLHLSGRAADIAVPSMTTAHVAACAEAVGAKGILRYITKNFVHIDTSESKNFAEYINGIRYDVPTHGVVSAYRIMVVTAIQERMNSLYGTELVVDGIYGPLTKRALLIGFQTELNRQYHAQLSVDGCWKMAVKEKCPYISAGQGNIPYIIQAYLYCEENYTSLSVDSIYGFNTYNAICSFQKVKRLAVIDGITGPETFAALMA